ncbi:MAG: hypothetical protein EBT93_17115 [Alphaproteobacteria bacterium]|nr:hypothetical protein [Alphaproteobacteria bacterium]
MPVFRLIKSLNFNLSVLEISKIRSVIETVFGRGKHDPLIETVLVFVKFNLFGSGFSFVSFRFISGKA